MMLRSAWAWLHVFAGVMLVGFALVLLLLSGFGFNEAEPAGWLNYAPVPFLAVLAVPRFIAAWRSMDRRRMALALAIVSGILAVATVALDYVTEYPCNPSPDDPRVDASPCTGMPLWATPLAAGWIFLGRLALAAPLLAAQRPSTFIGATALFVLGAAVGIIPAPLPDGTDWQYLRFLGAFLVLVGLGVAYAAMAFRGWGSHGSVTSLRPGR